MRDRQLRAASTLNRALTEAKSKGLARLSKNAAAHAQQLVRGASGHGAKLGEGLGGVERS